MELQYKLKATWNMMKDFSWRYSDLIIKNFNIIHRAAINISIEGVHQKELGRNE